MSMRQLRNVLLLLTLFGLPAWCQSLKFGDVVPNFKLTDQFGKAVSLSDFRGRGVVISFLYTRCPYPDKCPMISKKLTSLAELMDKLGRDKSLQVFAISIDPEFDRPEVIRNYAKRFDKNGRWKFLTGKPDQVASVARGFGIMAWDQNGVLEHNLRTVFIDAEGKLRLMKTGSDWRAGEFAAELAPYLK